ncbi:MAG: cell division protein FtsH, partial [Propionibacteriaceae bacterium]|nr:cell division protein FtsH [Propionibacteriaceae bacterium]
AQNDIEKATKVARAMVMQYGMSERVGAVQLGGGDSEPFMGMQGSQPSKDFSENSAAIVDSEVAKLIHTAHQEAFDVLVENRDVLDELVRQLFAKETLNRNEVAEVFKALRRSDKRPAWTGSDSRVPSGIPPIEVPAVPVRPVVGQPVPTPELPASGTPGDVGLPPTPGPDTWDPPSWAPPQGPRS